MFSQDLSTRLPRWLVFIGIFLFLYVDKMTFVHLCTDNTVGDGSVGKQLES